MTNYSEALESKFTALKDSLRAKANGYESDGFRRTWGRAERALLRCAEPYYWSKQITDAVLLSSVDLPADTAISLERFAEGYAGWFWFENIVALESITPFQGILWTRQCINGKRDVCLATYARRDGYVEVVDSFYLEELKTLQECGGAPVAIDSELIERQGLGGMDIEHNPSKALSVLRLFIAQTLWIEQRILITPKQTAERHVRRRLEKVVIEPVGIKVVHLRRAANESGQVHGNGHVEWTCQWIVRGHWRQQFYPSTGERSPLWIMPYVKGPEDAPLKVPAATVFAVTR